MRMPINHLLVAAKLMSPSVEVERAFKDLPRKVQDDYGLFAEEEICKALLQGMLDGIQHGNWPGQQS